jgi:hypothetical protein
MFKPFFEPKFISPIIENLIDHLHGLSMVPSLVNQQEILGNFSFHKSNCINRPLEVIMKDFVSLYLLMPSKH